MPAGRRPPEVARNLRYSYTNAFDRSCAAKSPTPRRDSRAVGRCNAKPSVRRAVLVAALGSHVLLMCVCLCGVQVTPIRRIRPHQSIDRMGARLAAQTSRNHATASWHRLRMGMGLMCTPNRTAESGIFRIVSARPDMRTQDTRRRAAAAGIFAPAGEPASCMKAACSVCHAHGMHVAAVAQVAAGLRLKRRLPGTCVRYHDNCCDLSEIAAPNGFRVQLEAMFPEYHVSLEPRARGHPWAIAVAPPHVARLFTFVPSVCSVHSKLGMGMPCDSCG